MKRKIIEIMEAELKDINKYKLILVSTKNAQDS